MAKKSYLTATDQFCGAGGSSIGATLAGVEVRLAMNHWKGEPVHTMTGVARAALVSALDSLKVEDLYFRMLRSHEIGKVMAFPRSYKVLGTERQKVKQYGNAVTPPAMETIMPRCVDSLR